MKKDHSKAVFWIVTAVYWAYFLYSGISNGYTTAMQFQIEGLGFSSGMILGAGLTLGKALGFYMILLLIWRPWKKKDKK